MIKEDIDELITKFTVYYSLREMVNLFGELKIRQYQSLGLVVLFCKNESGEETFINISKDPLELTLVNFEESPNKIGESLKTNKDKLLVKALYNRKEDCVKYILVDRNQYKQDVDIPVADRVYITNATARSVAYNACIYYRKINGILDDMPDKYQIEFWKKHFLIQSDFFLEQYGKLVLHCDEFIDSLTIKEKFKYFHINSRKEIHRVIRRVFHDNINCRDMRNDYEDEEVILANSGVFNVSNALNNESTYVLNGQYLRALGMRLCKCCHKYPYPTNSANHKALAEDEVENLSDYWRMKYFELLKKYRELQKEIN